MKTRLFAIVILLAGFSFGLQAQSYEYPQFHLGLRAGVTNNTISVSSEYDIDGIAFVYGGVAFDYRVTSTLPLYLETGVYYMNRGYRDRYRYGNRDNLHFAHFINTPLLVSYHHYFTDNMAIQPFIGMYAGFQTDEKQVDGGIRLGCGLNYKRIYANVGYDIDLGYVDPYRQKCHMFFFTLGFNILGY